MNTILKTALAASVVALAAAVVVVGAVLRSQTNANGAGDVNPLRGSDGPLLMGVTPAQPPYAYRDEKTGEICGIDVDIVRAAAARLGRRLELRPMPFSSLLPSVQDGTVDLAASCITITEGRRRSVDFSAPYAVEGSAFLYRTGETVPTMITIESMNVAVIESMSQDFYLTRHGLDPRRYRTFERAVEDLASNKVDVVAYDRPALKVLADRSGGRFAVTPLETRERYGVAVHKGCPEILAAVNEAIAERSAK